MMLVLDMSPRPGQPYPYPYPPDPAPAITGILMGFILAVSLLLMVRGRRT